MVVASPAAIHPSVRGSRPGNNYSGAVQRCLSVDQPVRGMNRASHDWGKGLVVNNFDELFANRPTITRAYFNGAKAAELYRR